MCTATRRIKSVYDYMGQPDFLHSPERSGKRDSFRFERIRAMRRPSSTAGMALPFSYLNHFFKRDEFLQEFAAVLSGKPVVQGRLDASIWGRF